VGLSFFVLPRHGTVPVETIATFENGNLKGDFTVRARSLDPAPRGSGEERNSCRCSKRPRRSTCRRIGRFGRRCGRRIGSFVSIDHKEMKKGP
jgi:hypothetical protein